MPNSYSRSYELTCPQCGQTFTADVYVTVDIKERHDLLTKIRSGALHNTFCPLCAYSSQLNLPLLIFRLDEDPHILHSPAQGMSQEDNRQQATELIDQLKASLGVNWHDDWLYKDGRFGIERQDLIAMVSDDPEAAFLQLAEQKIVELANLRIEDPKRYLEGMLGIWVNTQGLAQKQQILENTPELLSPDADILLRSWIEKAQENQDTQDEQIFQVHFDLISMCREEGVGVVFEKLERLKIEQSEEHLEISFGKWFSAPNLAQKRQVLEEIPELLTSDAEAFLRAWLENVRAAQDNESEKLLQWHLDVLENCRVEGVSVAFERLQNQKSDSQEEISSGLQELLVELSRLDQPADIPRKIELCRQILDSISRESYPNLWGVMQGELAENLAHSPFGDHAENLEQAIRHLELALEVTTREVLPEGWVKIQHNLATAYTDRIRGDRADNLEQAIRHLELALEVFMPQANPEGRAETQGEIANKYSPQVQRERTENLKKAIQNLKLVEEVFGSKDLREAWAGVQRKLGGAYFHRIRGDRTENLEQALQHFEQALELVTPEASPQPWAETVNGLANVYFHRIRGDRMENIEQAIKYCEQALNVYSLATFPEDWALLMHNLGETYRVRIRGDRAENLEKAIEYYEQALQVHTRQAFPVHWAGTISHLAAAYIQRIHGEKADNLEQAIRLFNQALEEGFIRSSSPDDWAQAMNNLAATYMERSGGEKADNLEQAIRLFNQALEVFTRQAYPERWAQIMNNLAGAYSHRIYGEHIENIEQAIRYSQAALEVRTSQAFPRDCRSTARGLGDLAFKENNWLLASDSYELALVAHEVLMQESFTRLSKQAELSQMQHVASHAAYAHVQLGKLERAVEVLELGRAQLLRDSLERQRHDLKQLPALGFNDLYEGYLQALRRYDQLQNLSQVPLDWSKQMERALEHIQSIAAAIRGTVGQRHPQYLHFLHALPFAEIQNQATQKHLVYLNTTASGGSALIVTKQGLQSFDLPELGYKAIEERLWHPSDEETRRINLHIREGIITLEDIRAAYGGFKSSYELWRRISVLATTPNELREALFNAWQLTLDEITRWLWDAVMEKLIRALKEKSGSIVLIPTGNLALLPLHAAWKEDPSRPTGRLYALDELNITIAPSAHALWQASLGADRPTNRLMAIDNPDGSLVFSTDEVQAAIDVFPQVEHLVGKDATVEAVKEEMQAADVLHFSTHGKAGWQEPEKSRLKLANGDLSLLDIFTLHLEGARLAVLSACETGAPGTELIEEGIGLPSGLMQAGIPGVIGSLWAVNDMSTAMLMARFYHLWRKEELSPPEALRQAQIWLRDSTTIEKKILFRRLVEQQTSRMSTKTAQAFYQHIGWDDPHARVFASPYYWAAFTYTGV